MGNENFAQDRKTIPLAFPCKRNIEASTRVAEQGPTDTNKKGRMTGL